MRKEQLGDNKTKEIRIIQDNAIWKVINHEGRTLDATRTRAEAEESVAIREHFSEYGGLAINAAEAQRDVASHLADASKHSGQ